MSDTPTDPPPERIFPPRAGDQRGPYGFGRPAHGGVPGAQYSFGRTAMRPLPLRNGAASPKPPGPAGKQD